MWRWRSHKSRPMRHGSTNHVSSIIHTHHVSKHLPRLLGTAPAPPGSSLHTRRTGPYCHQPTTHHITSASTGSQGGKLEHATTPMR